MIILFTSSEKSEIWLIKSIAEPMKLWSCFVFALIVKTFKYIQNRNKYNEITYPASTIIPTMSNLDSSLPPPLLTASHWKKSQASYHSIFQYASPEDKDLYLFRSFKGIRNTLAALTSFEPQNLISQTYCTGRWFSSIRQNPELRVKSEEEDMVRFPVYQLSYKNKVSAFDLNILKALTEAFDSILEIL